jgi:hypothetical protein
VPTRLARQAVTAAALRGDGPALAHSGTSGYDRRRAAAFRSALAGDRQLALGELGLGGGVRSVRLGLDIAIIELLTQGAAPAVEAVRLALRDGVHGEPDVPVVLAACVRLDPEVARSALGVALSGGTPLERTRAAAAVIGAARPGPVQAAVPALVAVSLAVAALAFMRLPGLTPAQESATPRLQEPRPSVVVAAPPRGVVSGTPPGQSGQSVTHDAVPIAVRFTPGGSGSASPDGTGSLNGREGSRPATPSPTPTTPAADGPSTPATMPPPSSPTPPVSSPPSVTSERSTAARPASAPPAAEPSAEPPLEPAVAKPSKAERTAAKAERKADKAEAKAARKAEKAAPASAAAAQPAPLTQASTPQPEAKAAVAPEPASAPENDDERRSKPDKPEKPVKPDKPEKVK